MVAISNASIETRWRIGAQGAEVGGGCNTHENDTRTTYISVGAVKADVLNLISVMH